MTKSTYHDILQAKRYETPFGCVYTKIRIPSVLRRVSAPFGMVLKTSPNVLKTGFLLRLGAQKWAPFLVGFLFFVISIAKVKGFVKY